MTERLHPDDLAAVIEAVTDAVRATATVDTPWLEAKEAADYLRAPLSRVRKLTSTRELPHVKDGRRVLYNRAELDAFLRGGGAKSP